MRCRCQMPCIISFILCGILLFSCRIVLAANESFSSLTTQDGLSDNNINAIVQDHYGFLWIATEAGLNKYDGKSITTYSYAKNNIGLADNEIVALLVDSRNRLWIGTEKGGMVRYDIDTQRFQVYRQRVENGRLVLDGKHLSNDTVHALATDNFGNLYIGTEGGGLNVLELATGKLSYYFVDSTNEQSLCHNEVKVIFRDKDGDMWFGTVNGLNRFTPPTGKFVCYRHLPESNNSLTNNEVVAIAQSSSGNLWVGTEGGGLNKFDKHSGEFHGFQHHTKEPNSLSHNEVQSVYVTKDDEVWVATINGLNKLDRDSQQFTHYYFAKNRTSSLSSNVISTLFEDRSGVFWVGTEGGGLNKMHPEPFPRLEQLYKDAIWNGQSISAVYVDNRGNTWVGTENLGLIQFNSANMQYTQTACFLIHCKGITEVTALQGSENTLWIATDGEGLVKYNLSSNQFESVSLPIAGEHSISALLVDKDYLLIGTEENRVFRHHIGSGQNDIFSLQPLESIGADYGNEVTTLFVDSQSRLWIGTEEFGLFQVDNSGKTINWYQHQVGNNSQITNNSINAIIEDKKERIWVATDYGLNVFSKNGVFMSSYFIEDGLNGNMVNSVLQDDYGDLWFATNRGLMRYQIVTDKFSQYDVSDGLVNKQFIQGAAYHTNDGVLVFGGNEGVDYFEPDKVLKNQIPPTVVLTQLAIFDQEASLIDDGYLTEPIYLAQEIALGHKDTVMSLSFAALDFHFPEKNSYAYFLEGFDNDWRYVGQHHVATYTNLPAGQYRFHVKGTNNDGVWSRTPASISIKVAAAPWNTWWAYAIYFCLTVLSIYGLIAFRLARQKEAFELTKAREEQQRIKDNYEMEQRFTSNVAHELRTPLSELISMSEVALMWPDDQRATQNFYRNTLNAAQQMQDIVSNLLALARCERGLVSLKYESLCLFDEINDCWLRFEQDAKLKGISLQLSVDEKIKIRSSQTELALILNNVISNAVEYSENSKPISICAQLQDDGSMSLTCINYMEVLLSASDLKNMFQRMWRKDASRSSEKHTGLGMALIKAYADTLNYGVGVQVVEKEKFVITIKHIPLANSH